MNDLELGKWNVICDRCGFKRKSDEVIEQWDGLIVCAPVTGKTCFETRHPLDFVKGKADNTSVPFTRPEQAEQFVDTDYVDSSVGTQETTIPTGTFTTNNSEL